VLLRDFFGGMGFSSGEMEPRTVTAGAKPGPPLPQGMPRKTGYFRAPDSAEVGHD